MASPPYDSAHITAVLGPTNTGKTHYAVERMLARESGVIGLPLRLLAREIYDKITAIKGVNACALITGEEKILPPHAQYFVCTVEAMPMEDIRAGNFACVVIDEVQLMGHKERGHIFTDRVLHARGTQETMLLGANTARPIIKALVPKARYHARERFSVLKFTGHEKISRLPKRSIIVAFSTQDVYAIAELVRRQFGGVAVVMGGLSPRARNAQAALYQSGEVDYMVATDAIGMGLNLDADHIAFAALRKFDGTRRRYLYAHEIGQIAGRAGRFRNNGTFGTTGRALPLDEDIVLRIENHEFEPMHSANWRNTDLKFDSVEALLNSLAAAPPASTLASTAANTATNKPGGPLKRIAPVMDEMVFERLLKAHHFGQSIETPADVRLLWEICQIPDFRGLGLEAHGRLLDEIARQLYQNGGTIPDEYLNTAIARLDHTDGAVDILASRLSAIRTWTYIAQKTNWVPTKTLGEKNWVSRTRKVEDKLSDALHTKLVQKFVDRRTSALLKRLGQKIDMDVEIQPNGDVMAEGHVLGRLTGLQFTPAESETDLESKTLLSAATVALGPEINKRLIQIAGSEHGQINLTDEGTIEWGGVTLAKLAPGSALLNPDITLIGGALGKPVLVEQAIGRLRDYLRTEIREKFAILDEMKAFIDDPKTFEAAKPLMRVLVDHYGVLRRSHHKDLIRATDRVTRGHIRNKGTQFSNFYVFNHELIKPGPARLISILFAYAWDQDGGGTQKPFLPPNGMSSTPLQPGYSEAVLNKAGYTRLNSRFVRFDILARLEKLIKHARAIPRYGQDQFRIAQQMMSVLGCGYDDMVNVLRAIGYEPVAYDLSDTEFEAERTILEEMFLARQARAQKFLARTQPGAKLKEDQAENANPLKNKPPESKPSESKPSENKSSEQQADPKVDTNTGTKQESPIETPKPAQTIQRAPTEPLPKKSVHKKRRAIVLDTYYVIPQADENGNPIISKTVDVWRPRVFKAAKPSGARSQRDTNPPHNKDKTGKAGDKRKPSRSGDKPSRHKYKQGGSRGTPKDKKPNPDSPFAALSALKFSKDSDKKGE